MGMPASRVKGPQWRITSKQQYQILMVKWLPFLVFLMVSVHVTGLYEDILVCSGYQLRNFVSDLRMHIGHGGSRTAEYLKNNLFKNLSGHPDFIKDTKNAIVEAFRQTDADYLSGENPQQRDAGSTASTAVMFGDRILVANVGDSRVVASKAGSALASRVSQLYYGDAFDTLKSTCHDNWEDKEAIPLSIDHKPDRIDERERIEQAGGFIIWAGTWRVGGVLAVSRAFGDKLLKPYVSAEPEIQEVEIDGVEFLIIASDGLWNVLSNKDAVGIVQGITDAEAALKSGLNRRSKRLGGNNQNEILFNFDSESAKLMGCLVRVLEIIRQAKRLRYYLWGDNPTNRKLYVIA
ncbi:Protein phosphatase 2C [Artemisia annua]|uniref:Protein phosphatase 2C n=1 Tax=Artemisia annua TaxID=35608 RepID=A0A2U1N923_ARTAN|nr:Protein phosphatase 2C [Artemisia annua]